MWGTFAKFVTGNECWTSSGFGVIPLQGFNQDPSASLSQGWIQMEELHKKPYTVWVHCTHNAFVICPLFKYYYVFHRNPFKCILIWVNKLAIASILLEKQYSSFVSYVLLLQWYHYKTLLLLEKKNERKKKIYCGAVILVFTLPV